ncbi:MAG: transposase [Gammaproteobacteria bacterium]
MARLLRLCPAGVTLHLSQRGNNRHTCFADEQDFAAYAHWLRAAAVQYVVAVHAWVFMTNHVHLLVTPTEADAVPRMMQTVGRRYVRYFNHRHGRTGTLWEGRYKSCVVQHEDYLLTCHRYIEMNPVRAGMVNRPQDYRWSSYHANGLGRRSELRTPHAMYLALGSDETTRLAAYRELFDAPINTHLVEAIRAATNKGLAFGNDPFKDEIEKLCARRVRPMSTGRRKARG